MCYLVVKYLTTAALVTIISETAKINDWLGALIAALPAITLLTFVWMHSAAQYKNCQPNATILTT